MFKFAIAIHGGASTITRQGMTADKDNAYRQALENALYQAEEEATLMDWSFELYPNPVTFDTRWV